MSEELDFEWEESETLDKVRALMEGSDEWAVEFRTPYAGHIEFGTGPAHEPDAHTQYWPKLQPLKEWVERKLGVSPDKSERVARAIQRSIHDSGMRPQPFARPAIDDAKAHMGEILKRDLSMEDVMQYIARRAREHIKANGTVDQGWLRARIFVVHRSSGEGEEE